MIVEFLLNIVKGIILFLIGLLPKFPSIDGFNFSDIGEFFKVLKSINGVLDLKILSICLLALLVFCNIEFVMRFVMWIVKKIPVSID